MSEAAPSGDGNRRPHRISVVVPTRNGAAHLAETLESVRLQSHPVWEVLVVDDGSEDGTAAIAASFGPPVRLLRGAALGPAAARNAGIREARGDFVAFLDHDDLWVPGKLALQIAAFERDPGLEVCVGRIQSFRRNGPGRDRTPVGKPVAGFLTITMLARRRVFDRVGLLDPSRQHSDSAEWFLRAADLQVAVRALPAVLTLHRLHGANHSLLDGEASRREFLHLARSRLRPGGASR